MTQILTYVSQHYILQTTDRLVTTGKGKPFDELANKNLVYCARNAVVTIGYTGCAYIARKPTDHWIAEKLTGEEFQEPPGPPSAHGIGFGTIIGRFLNPWLDIGLSLIYLRDALNNAVCEVRGDWRRDWLRMPFEVIVAGYQWKKSGRIRPIIAQIVKPPFSDIFELKYEKRDWYLGEKVVLIDTPIGNIDSHKMCEMVKSIPGTSIDDVESIFVDSIREVSKDNPAVGPHCMSILIFPPSSRMVCIRFIPAEMHSVLITSSGRNSRKICAYSPWIIGPDFVSGPAIINGNLEAPLGPYTVRVEAPHADGMVGFSFFAAS